MRRLLLMLGICLAVFCAAFAARIAFVPDVVAVAYEQGPQSVWSLEAAFLLQSIENVSLAAAVLVLAIIVGTLIRPMLRRRGRSSDQPKPGP